MMTLFRRLKLANLARPRGTRIATFSLVLASLVEGSNVRAQTLSMDWSAIGGSGTTVTAGGFRLSGTFGAPCVRTLRTNGDSILSGFWSVVPRIATHTHPVLWIRNTGTNALQLTWDAGATGYVLQQNLRLEMPGWTPPGMNVGPVQLISGGLRFRENQVLVRPLLTPTCYVGRVTNTDLSVRLATNCLPAQHLFRLWKP